MKRSMLAVLAMASAFAVQASVASAAPEGYRYSVREDAVEAQVQSYIINPEGWCGKQTAVFVSGFDGAYREGPGKAEPRSVLYVDLYSFDECTGEYRWGGTYLDPADLEIGRLQGTEVFVTFEVFDEWTGVSIPATVDLSIQGVGEATRAHYMQSIHNPEYTYRARMNGTFREATVTGTVMLGGEDLMAGAYTYGQLAHVNQGEAFVARF